MKDLWTHFWDMGSGGSQKQEWGHIFIQAPMKEAKAVFFSRFGANPDRVSCTCCGGDYAIDSGKLLALTGYHRGCKWDDKRKRYVEKADEERLTPYRTQKAFEKDKDVLFIRASKIKDSERRVEIPEQGYIWKD